MSVSAEVATLFLDELAKRNIAVAVDEEGHYVIDAGEMKLNISLENLSRDFARDRDPERISDFVDSITRMLETPSWEEAKTRIRWQAEPSDHKFGDVFHDMVSDKVALVLVYVDPSESQIKWLSPGDAEEWGQTRDDLFAAATENMNRLLRQTPIETDKVEEHVLGMLSTKLVAFKAALLFCPDLKEVVEPVLGWPIYAVMPCRDFVYIINQKDRDLLGRMGGVVIREYEESGYPISTEAFEISDDGIRAIGDYQKAAKEEEELEDDEDEGDDDGDEDAEGMKTIRYRGGVVTFRIPAFWEEEYQEDGGGTFYDDDNDAGTLRLSILGFQSKGPVTTRTARSLLERSDEPNKSEVIDLGGGNAMIQYSHEVEEDGEPLTVYYWQIANPVPPNHIRMALFSYTVNRNRIGDKDVTEEYEMLDRELRACKFAAEYGS